MTEQLTIKEIKQDKQDNLDRAIKTAALDYAIKSNCGQSYNQEGVQIVSADKIIEGAQKFENFIKGTLSKKESFIEGVSSHPNNPETKLKPIDKKEKENW